MPDATPNETKDVCTQGSVPTGARVTYNRRRTSDPCGKTMLRGKPTLNRGNHDSNKRGDCKVWDRIKHVTEVS